MGDPREPTTDLWVTRGRFMGEEPYAQATKLTVRGDP